MASSRGLNKPQGEPVRLALQHMKGLSKAQVAEDVRGKVVAPVAHLTGLGPSLGLFGRTIQSSNLLAKRTDIVEDVPLHLLHGALREGLGHDTTLASVHLLVAGVVGVGGRVDKGIVELGLANIGAEAKDLLQGLVGVKAERVGTEADDGSVLFVHTPELEVTVTLPGVVELVAIGNLGEEGARILG